IIRRSFSLFRTPNTTSLALRAARDGHDTIRIQRVHFRKRFFSVSRIIGTTVTLAGAYAFLSWVDGELEALDEEEIENPAVQSKNPEEVAREGREITDEEEDEDEDEEEGLIFFPTGFSRPKPRTFYKGSDPEWQEFVKLARDRNRINRIRGELVVLVRGLAVKNPQYSRRLGKIDPTKGSTWIDVVFPDGPPIEYERPGYELTDELTFRQTTQDVHELHHQRMKNLLVPTAVAHSVYQDSKSRADGLWQGFKNYLGWQETSKPDAAQKLLTQFPMPPPSSPKSPAPSTTASSTASPPPAPSTAEDSAKPSTTPSPLSNPANERFGLALPDPTKVPTLNLSHFRRTLHQHHKQTHMSAPRGAFFVRGLIEIVGERAKMTLDVTAAYDPKLGKYVMLSVRLRQVKDFHQRPRG
ncbi:hypothetical protein P280DRAFT_378860, partial [Massarina eburnea CBS 473.64]